VKPAPFEYHRPESLDEAAHIMARHAGDARALAGGQSLLPLLFTRAPRPAHLVDLQGGSHVPPGVPRPPDLLNQDQLLTILNEFVADYNRDRPHRSLGLRTPEARDRCKSGVLDATRA